VLRNGCRDAAAADSPQDRHPVDPVHVPHQPQQDGSDDGPAILFVLEMQPACYAIPAQQAESMPIKVIDTA
jgi:hypothetical protein